MVPFGWWLFITGCIERFLSGLGLLLRPYERLYRGNKRTGNEQEVQIENPDDIEQRVETGHNPARFNGGYVRLGQPDFTAQLPLAPAATDPRFFELFPEIHGKPF